MTRSSEKIIDIQEWKQRKKEEQMRLFDPELLEEIDAILKRTRTIKGPSRRDPY